ncbi:MAG: CBS domain-containing protein [Candidatus Bathyarchaeia archaeon]
MAANPFVKVREAMSSPVVTAGKDEKIGQIAKLMEKHNIGCVVILDSEKKPVGVITDRDIVIRVFAKGTAPSKLRAADIMSSPIATISSDKGIDEAARIMNKLGLRRLVVMDGAKLIGIISSRDILRVTPALVEIITEKARLGMKVTSPKTSTTLIGYCEICGQWSEVLREVEGKLACDDCATELASMEEHSS